MLWLTVYWCSFTKISSMAAYAEIAIRMYRLHHKLLAIRHAIVQRTAGGRGIQMKLLAAPHLIRSIQ